MTEEVNSKAPAASSTANRGVPSQNRWEDVDVRRRHVAGLRGQLSRYRATICLIGFHAARQAIATNHRKTRSHLMRSHLRLAQHDKRKSENDGRGDHGSELGKYRPQSARSELECLAPCSPTQIVHVGLHVATSSWARRPATAGARGKGGRSTQGNNSPWNKRTVRHRCKIGTSGMAGRRDAPIDPATSFAVFPPWFSGSRGGEPRAVAAN